MNCFLYGFSILFEHAFACSSLLRCGPGSGFYLGPFFVRGRSSFHLLFSDDLVLYGRGAIFFKFFSPFACCLNQHDCYDTSAEPVAVPNRVESFLAIQSSRCLIVTHGLSKTRSS